MFSEVAETEYQPLKNNVMPKNEMNNMANAMFVEQGFAEYREELLLQECADFDAEIPEFVRKDIFGS